MAKTTVKTAPAKKAAKKAAPAEKTAKASKTVATPAVSVEDMLADLKRISEAILVAVSGGKAKMAAPAAVADEDAAPAFNAKKRKKELEAMDVKALRKLAIKLEFPEADVKKAKEEQLVLSILEAEEEEASKGTADEDGDDEDAEDADTDDDESEDDDAEDDGDSDDEDEDEEGDEYSREELQGKSLKELKAIVKAQAEENDDTAPDMKNMDKDTVIDIILGEDDEDEDSDDEDDEEETDDDEAAEEDEDRWYTVKELNAMDESELKAIAKENAIKLKKGATKKDMVAALKE